MKNIGGSPSLLVKEMQCNVCNGVFYEFDEQIEKKKWVGWELIDFRLDKCPHCDEKIIHETVQTLSENYAYVEVDKMTGEVKVYGGF
ncbi:hypothetical protein P4V86_15590 [Brevibacillus laterosporus]|uniref:hypothetical protein n=1 Tax=Brevibacillus laterosporus TaxID=1465 RepID=UPI00036BD0E2|nr:hypothetical protein [Brevibacillus laterosporus]ATO50973.1 hypothetical protein BrL25_18865 [Brevibacillus laterosporus DSM 25]MED2004769.1 hypothetical protein [Brevibacillus laterosporus]